MSPTPFLVAQRGEGLGDGFVQGFGRHVDRVRGVVQIVDNDGAGFEGHDGNLSYSLFVRLTVSRRYLKSVDLRSSFMIRWGHEPEG
jgi:hypothetical protein